jgi:uncharacterized Zn finger protein
VADNVETKGRRLLTEGRLIVTEVGERGVIAECRGDSGAVYTLGYRHDESRWGCTCPARGRCAHLVALQLVTIRRTEDGDTSSG